ncbi:MerR family transcriptional regulator [Fischerella thermalis CCMEE 5330]|uniref:MerR family transcriptional regulator n=1 Tax=Fischerella thermalis CCMEE 5330 TaxID=2019670 RepID=A0A2N6MAF5_9CYAN|nr:MerR family transcriptional regulator [Fischerella thermalis]PMB43753.1 MerR family transcriptional regulator [Fischerella thermalis CCMEE 5330]
MLKIGDFSKLSQVSVKALRLYDQLGLIKPVDVDNFTGYRYYSAEQLPRLNRILALKDLGFSLEQIAKLLDENLPSTEIRGMLRLKQAELQHLVEEEQARLLRVEARLKQIEQEDNMPNYEVVIKKVEPIKVASIREKLPDYPSVGQLYDELLTYFNQQGVKKGTYCAGIWHDPGYKDSNVDGEAVISIEKDISNTERIRIYELPRFEKMACLVHHRSYNTLNQAYAALVSWIEGNGYQIIGPNREVYITGGNEQDNECYITEVQFPVTKA